MNTLLALRPAVMHAITTATEKGAPAQSRLLRAIDPAGGPAIFGVFTARVNAETHACRLIDPPEAALHQAATHTSRLLIRSQIYRASAKETR